MTEPARTKSKADFADINPWLIFLFVVGAIFTAWLAYPSIVGALAADDDWTKRGQFGDTFGALNTLFSGLAFAALIVAVILQTRELQLQRKELADTRSVLEDSARAARASADAATASANALRMSERAYVFVKIHEASLRTVDKTATARVNMSFVNHGKTPAMVTRVVAGLTIASQTPSHLPGEGLPEMDAGFALAAGAAHNFPVSASVPFELARKVLDEKGLTEGVFCVGLVEYLDVLGEPHSTGLCWRFAGSRQLTLDDSPLNRRT